MPLLLSRADARRAAMACRALGHHNREAAACLDNPEAKAIKTHEAWELERIAELFEEHAGQPPQGNVAPIWRKR